MSRLTSSKVAEILGVNVETLRYYERIGLAPKPGRTQGGHRVYSEEDIEKLKFIRRARTLGFSIDETRALMGLADPANRLAVRAIAVERLKKIEAELEEKRHAAEMLAQSIAACESHTCGCQIMDMLKRAEEGKASTA
jgi:MerR family mercuric resistance operon transcriptional regulator